MSKFQIKIRHPEWLRYSKPQSYIDVYLAGKMPPSVAGWIMIVGLKHPLRAIYGSDFRAAWALLVWALRDKMESWWFELIGRNLPSYKKMEKEFEEMDRESGEEKELDGL